MLKKYKADFYLLKLGLVFATLFGVSSCTLFSPSQIVVKVEVPAYKIIPLLAKQFPLNVSSRGVKRKFESKYFKVIKNNKKFYFIEVFKKPYPKVRYRLFFEIQGQTRPYHLLVTPHQEIQKKGRYVTVPVSDRFRLFLSKYLTHRLAKNTKSINLIDDFRVF